VKNHETYYEVKLAEEDVEELKNAGPFILDKKLWTELEKQELQILRGYGDYLDKVF